MAARPGEHPPTQELFSVRVVVAPGASSELLEATRLALEPAYERVDKSGRPILTVVVYSRNREEAVGGLLTKAQLSFEAKRAGLAAIEVLGTRPASC